MRPVGLFMLLFANDFFFRIFVGFQEILAGVLLRD